MWRLFTAFVLAVAYLVSVSQSAELSEEAQRNARVFGTFNRYYIYTWSHAENRLDPEEVTNDASAIEEISYLNGTETLVVVVHGREDAAFSEFGETLRASLLMNDQDVVVLLVDWSVVAQFPYASASTAVSFVAEDIVNFIATLVEADKLDLNFLHLVGFDLGAHIVGVVSRDSRARARRITGLDPAGEGWDQYSRRLRASDANYVEVIHTDGDGNSAFGLGEAIGHIDFFPNGGTRQPGCSNRDNACHHRRAWELYAATLDYNGHLQALRCDTMTQMSNNRCVGTPAVAMGTNAWTKIGTGIYRVNTGRTYPYAA